MNLAYQCSLTLKQAKARLAGSQKIRTGFNIWLFLVLLFWLLCSLTSKEVNLTEWPLNCQLKCYMKSRLMLLGLIMKFLLSAITMRPTYMTIIPSGPNLMVEFKTFGRWLVYFITQQSDQLYRSNMVWISRCRAIYYN